MYVKMYVVPCDYIELKPEVHLPANGLRTHNPIPKLSENKPAPVSTFSKEKTSTTWAPVGPM